MTIEDLRLRQRQAHQTAIEQRRSSEGISRIGQRDPETGRYEVIAPDGSASRDGIKIFTADAPGTPVLSTDRTDGLKVLDSLKPTDRPYFPEPLGTPRLYREGRVFEIPEPVKKQTKGPIHILFADQGKLWVGGHQDDPEEVIVPTFTGLVTDSTLWADRSGWVFSKRNYPGTPNSKIYSYDSEGAAYTSPATPNGKFISAAGGGTGSVGFGTFVLTDRTSSGINQQTNSYVWHRGVWTFVNAPYQIPANQDWSYSVTLPQAILAPTVLTRQNQFADVGPANNTGPMYSKYWNCRCVDRDSVFLLYTSEDYSTGDYTGYSELNTRNAPPQQLYPWLENDFLGTGSRDGVPFGMYTDRNFTHVTSPITQLNNLKSGPGLITIAITNLARITTTQQVEAAKIPATANIISYCTTIT